MASDNSGIATVITSGRLSSQRSTLRESFLASDLVDSLNNTNIINSNNNSCSSNRRPISSVTLGAVLNSDKKSPPPPPPPPSNVVQTLLEIIHNNETTINRGSSPNSLFVGKKSWKSFKERLKLRRAIHSHSSNSNQNRNPNYQDQVASSSSSSTTTTTMNTNKNALGNSLRSNSLRSNSLRSNSLRFVDSAPADDLALREVDGGGSPRSGGSFRLSAALEAEREQTRLRLSRELVRGNGNGDEEVAALGENSSSEGEEDGEREEVTNMGPPANQPAVRMSLMDLLEETDRQAGINGPTYRLDDKDEEEEEEEVVLDNENLVKSDDQKGEHSCCVCMVRHKGAAFIPCGHTFCRLCSRELWVQRGNCPLCNNFILEILDIF